jgi:hypothetical protein
MICETQPRLKMRMLAVLSLCLASAVLADDFKTTNGKEYKDAKVSRVEPDGVVISFRGGIVKIPFRIYQPKFERNMALIRKQLRISNGSSPNPSERHNRLPTLKQNNHKSIRLPRAELRSRNKFTPRLGSI